MRFQDKRGQDDDLPGGAQRAQAPGKRTLTEPVQLRGNSAAEAETIKEQAAEGTSGTAEKLPHGDAIQQSFGKHDVSGVAAHQDKPAQEASAAMGAMAFASGNHVAFREAPDKFTAAHEAAHVVQQRAGVQLREGVGSSGDRYEQNADAVAQAVVDGRSAEPLLDEVAGGGRGFEAPVQMDEDPAAEPTLSPTQVRAAIAFNRGRRIPADAWAQIGKMIGAGGDVNEDFVKKLAAWQRAKGLAADGQAGDITFEWLSHEPGGEGLGEHVKSEKILFMGLNPASKNVENNVLKNAAGAGNVTSVLGSAQQDKVKVGNAWADLTSDEGVQTFLGTLPNLSPARAKQIADFLQDTGEGAKDEIAGMITHLYAADTGRALFKRVVLSGHSWGSGIWGDDNGEIPFHHLDRLMKLFPNAAAQVEDLMFSACNTGQLGRLDQYHAMFPNLKSIWGYAGYSPSAATGSTRHISEWEKSSRGHDAGKVATQGQARVNAGSGPRDQNVAVWTEDTGYSTKSHYAEMGFDEVMAQVQNMKGAYDAAFLEGNIDKPKLDELQTMLQTLTGMHADRLGPDLATYQGMNARTLYLRHFANIATNFAAHHKQTLQAGYTEAGKTMPAYGSLGRAGVLAHIKEFEGAVKGNASRAAAKLLTEVLRDLDPAQIPSNWN